MSTIVFASAKGSPGVSVAALSLAWSWQRKVIVAECDPAGSDAMPGLLQGQIPATIGIGELPVMHARGRLETDFWGQLVDLDAPKREKLLLPGVVDLADGAGIRSAATTLAGFFAALGSTDPAYDVIADAGRLSTVHTMWPLIDTADLVVLVVTGTMASIQHTRMAITAWQERYERGGGDSLRLLVVGDGPYHKEIGKKLDVPVLGTMPFDRSAAAVFAHGPVGKISKTNGLVRAWQRLHLAVSEAITDSRVRRGVREVADVA